VHPVVEIKGEIDRDFAARLECVLAELENLLVSD
jgi:hypothetical protein